MPYQNCSGRTRYPVFSNSRREVTVGVDGPVRRPRLRDLDGRTGKQAAAIKKRPARLSNKNSIMIMPAWKNHGIGIGLRAKSRHVKPLSWWIFEIERCIETKAGLRTSGG